MNIRITANSVSDETVEEIRCLRQAGINNIRISKMLGIRYSSLDRICKLYDLPTNYRRIGVAEKADDAIRPYMVREMTMLHLRDILREHGFNKTWENYDIPPETAKPMRCYPSSSLSICGSPAVMCEEIAG